MKNQVKYCTPFPEKENDTATNKTREIKTGTQRINIKQSFIMFFYLITILLLSASCDRNVASGCGTWPMVSSKNDRSRNSMYKSDVRPANYKNNKQYTYYKKYN